MCNVLALGPGPHLAGRRLRTSSPRGLAWFEGLRCVRHAAIWVSLLDTMRTWPAHIVSGGAGRGAPCQFFGLLPLAQNAGGNGRRSAHKERWCFNVDISRRANTRIQCFFECRYGVANDYYGLYQSNRLRCGQRAPRFSGTQGSASEYFEARRTTVGSRGLNIEPSQGAQLRH